MPSGTAILTRFVQSEEYLTEDNILMLHQRVRAIQATSAIGSDFFFLTQLPDQALFISDDWHKNVNAIAFPTARQTPILNLSHRKFSL